MSRIAVFVGDKETRQFIAECLRDQQHEVIAPDSPAALEEPYDLGILDASALYKLREYVDARKNAERPVFAAFLLVTSRQDTAAETQDWEAVYDFIVTPVQEAELLARVRSLLRARSLSLDVRTRSTELQAVMDANPDLYFWLDDDFRIIQYHAREEYELYVGPDAFIGHTFADFLPPEAAASMRAACDHTRATGKMGSGECVLNMPDGDRTFEARVVSLPENRLLMIVRDVTDRVQAVTELRKHTEILARSNSELQQFVYVASHDLQEPLRMVTSYVQLLQKRYHDKLDEDADTFIQYAVDGAHRMQRLIGGLLEYSRIQTRGKEFAPVDCEAALNEAVSNLQTAIEEAGAIVTHGPLPTVMVDEAQLAAVASESDCKCHKVPQ